MHQEIIQIAADRYIVGLAVITNNQECFDPKTNKIGPLIARYWQENVSENIPHRKNPGVTLSIYTHYETNEHGNYTYFFGEEVSSLEHCPAGLSRCIIPAGKFVKLTTPQGKMPDVVIDAWIQIWKMTATDLGGKRVYLADFEIYDERASDPNAASIDIMIGIE